MLVKTHPGYALALEGWHFILQEGMAELYNLNNDPKERINLAGWQETATIEADLRTRLASLVKDAVGQKQAGKLSLLDTEHPEGFMKGAAAPSGGTPR